MLVFYKWLLLAAFIIICVFPYQERVAPGKVTRSVLRGIRWIDTVDADPFLLNSQGLKGKKHFMEKLYAYYQVYKHTDDETLKDSLHRKMKRMLKITENPAFHELPENEMGFKSEIMTYLHICYLMEQLGGATKEYRRIISGYLPRLQEHILLRYITPRLMFVNLLQSLNLASPVMLEPLISQSKTAEMRDLTHANINGLKFVSYVYDICHEVFVFTNYGARPVTFLEKEYQQYLVATVPMLVERILEEGDWKHINLLAELLVCYRYLDIEETSVYYNGIEAVLAMQQDDGSFGDYDIFEQYCRDKGIEYNVTIKKYLHATEVCLWALALAQK